MTKPIVLVATLPVVLALGATLVLVLVFARKTINETSFFSATRGRIVAACAAALPVMGLVRFFGPPGHAAYDCDIRGNRLFRGPVCPIPYLRTGG
jgi:hypothetical protein